MSQKTVVLIVVLFVLIIAGMFGFAYLKQSEIKTETEPLLPPETSVEENLYPEITRVDAKHYFIDGTHTLVGELNLPTPCDLLEAEATVMESYPEQVRIDFSVINNAEMCAQVLTTQRFKVDFLAASEAVIVAEFMGREVVLNLVPTADGEKPEDFELFIKG